MKQLTCEMCGSTDLLKQDGVFVCQSCGCKYSVEEAKKMMIEGTVEVQGTVKVDQSHLIDNYIDMAISALDSKNYAEAEQYCNKVIEIAPNNYKAYLYKGTAAAWQSTFAKIRILETVNCWERALKNFDDENVTEFIAYTDAEFERIIIAMVNLAGSFVEDGVSEYKRNSYREHLTLILQCIELYVRAINSKFPVDDVCYKATESVIPFLMECAEAEERSYHKHKPTSGSIDRFLGDFLFCIDLLNATAVFGKSDAAKALCYDKAVDVFEKINKLPFYHWSATTGRYEKLENTSNAFGSQVKEYKEKANEARKRIEEKRKEKIRKDREAFWSVNSAEYKLLNDEIQKSKAEIDKLVKTRTGHTKIGLINNHISNIKSILGKNREKDSQISESERTFIQNLEAFWLKLPSNDGYDAYLDQYPILKKTDSLKRKRETILGKGIHLQEKKDSVIPNNLWPFIAALGLGFLFTPLGIAFLLTGSGSVLLLVCGGLLLVSGIIGTCYCMKEYSENKASVRELEAEYEKDVCEYNATVDEMNSVPKYTGTEDHVPVKIPEKIDKTTQENTDAKDDASAEKYKNVYMTSRTKEFAEKDMQRLQSQLDEGLITKDEFEKRKAFYVEHGWLDEEPSEEE